MKNEELKVGDRVRDSRGKEGVVVQPVTTGPSPSSSSIPVAVVRYDDGSGIGTVCDADSLTVIPKEPIREGDRVRHSCKVASEYRRLGGRVVSVNVTGRSVVVLWDGINSYREELVSQLDVIHRAEKTVPTPMERIKELLDAEGAVVAAEIYKLELRLRALNAAKSALS